jgi:hypothetical protein
VDDASVANPQMKSVSGSFHMQLTRPPCEIRHTMMSCVTYRRGVYVHTPLPVRYVIYAPCVSYREGDSSFPVLLRRSAPSQILTACFASPIQNRPGRSTGGRTSADSGGTRCGQRPIRTATRTVSCRRLTCMKRRYATGPGIPQKSEIRMLQ